MLLAKLMKEWKDNSYLITEYVKWQNFGGTLEENCVAIYLFLLGYETKQNLNDKLGEVYF